MVWACVAGAWMLSCTREQVAEEVDHLQKEFSFQVEVAPWKQTFPTKGVPYGEWDHVEDLSFGVSAYTSAPGGSEKRYFAPTKVAFDKQAGKWTMDAPVTWPDQNGTIRFFAYAPYDAETMEAGENELPKLHYSASKMDMEEQRGLLVYASEPMPDYPATSSGAEIKFSFRHVLSAVCFIMAEGIEIESVGISGVYDEGTYGFAGGEWGDLKVGSSSYMIEHPEVEVIDGFAFLDEKYIMMFPPQVCPDGAVIHLKADGKSIDIPLAGQEWKEGHIVLYILGRNDYNYEFEVQDVDDLLSEGGEVDVDVESWRERDGGEKEWVPWIVEGYYATEEDAQAKENKLTDSFVKVTLSDSQGVDGKGALHMEYAVAGSRMEEHPLEDDINRALAAAPERGTAQACWNLSNPEGGDGIVESANTYVVTAPGYYRIPLVMGAAVKDEAVQSAAFEAENFKDYLDAAILSPYLHLSSAGAGIPTQTCVIWEDRPLVDVQDQNGWELKAVDGGESAISFDGTVYWMNFHIGAQAMGQGLVHIAVLDDRGLVMWSYLLWVTPSWEEDAGISSKNLGWIEKGVVRETVYDETTVYVRLEQQRIGGKHEVFRVHRPEQRVQEAESDGYSPYYQFGRKDPLIPSVGNNDVAMYGLHTALEQTTAKSTVGRSIREPWAHLSYGIKSPFDWCQETGLDNWWTSKTVYDPCPAGHRIPSDSELTGFAGELHLAGYRNSAKGQPVNVGKEGYYWSSSAVDEDNAAILHVGVDGAVKDDVARRSRGLTVRPFRQ